MSYEPAIAKIFLWEKLNAAPILAVLPGGWHEGIAEEGAPSPLGVVHMEAAAPDLTDVSHKKRILTNALWMVKIIGILGDTDQNLDTIASMVDDALDHASGDAGTGHVYMVTREFVWAPPPYLEEGRIYRETGGRYRVYVQDPVAV